MTQFGSRLFVALVFVILNLDFAAAEGTKSQYHLFNPTPLAQMRELSTDRPDKTESAYTVDAGHFQIEADLVSFTRDRDNASGTEVKTFNYMPMNLKAGLTDRMDLQLVLAPYRQEEESANGVTEKRKGVAETLVRLKVNVFGNNEEGNALALMPFIKLPTAGDGLDNKKYEGGLIAALAVALPNDLGMGVMFQVNRAKNGADNDYHNEFVSSATVSHSLCGQLGGYLEFYSESSAEDGAEWVATGDMGLTYGLTPNLQLDAGLNYGLTDAADDMNTFLGISARF